MPSQSPTGETLTLDYADGWAAVNRLIRQGDSWSGREMDCAYWNAGDGSFVDVSNTLGVAFKGDGRAFAQVDWDSDGDLDLWLVNRTAPRAQFLRNNAAPASFLRLQLQGSGTNTEAVGARVEVRANGRLVVDERRLGSGFLSQSSSWLHFGLGDATGIESVVVFWPNGEEQSFPRLRVGGSYVLKQGHAGAEGRGGPARFLALSPSKPAVGEPGDSARIAIARRLVLPELELIDFEGNAQRTGRSPQGRPKLVSFWASWCPNCMRELRAWGASAARFEEIGLDLLALSVDEDPADAQASWKNFGLPFAAGLAPERWIAVFDLLQRLAVDRQREMAVPTSFLLDADGSIAAIYRGPVDVEVLADDVRALGEDPPAFAGLPFEGRAFASAQALPLFEIARRLLDQERPQDALFYIDAACRQVGPAASAGEDGPRISDALTRTGMYFLAEKEFDQADAAFTRAIEYAPSDSLPWFGRARLRAAQADPRAGLTDLEEALRLDDAFAPAWELRGTLSFLTQDLEGARTALHKAISIDVTLAQAWSTLGVVEMSSQRFAEGVQAFGKATELSPQSADAWTGLGVCYLQTGRSEEGAQALERALEIDPSNARALQIMQQLGRR